jgi:aldose 1-epimerase
MTLITLRSGAAHLRLAPETGGSIAGYWQEDAGRRIDWLRPAPEAALAHRMPLDFASFPLVPYSGRIRDGRFRFGGRSLVVPLNFLPERHAIHGPGASRPRTRRAPRSNTRMPPTTGPGLIARRSASC